jgi:hypothetical protein
MDIAHERLRSLGITPKRWKRPLDVVSGLVASQAQDFAGAKWSLALRTPGASDRDVEQAFDAGHILRTHVMRPTWHFVAQEDARWLLELTAQRVHGVNGPYYRKLGLEPATSRGRRKCSRARSRAGRSSRETSSDPSSLEPGSTRRASAWRTSRCTPSSSERS